MTRNSSRRGYHGSWFQTLRAFQIECWTLGWVCLFWLPVTDMWTSFGDFVPNSNIALVSMFAFVAALVGSRALQLRDLPITALLPGCATTLYWVCIFSLSVAALVGAVYCWLVGNTRPAFGPGLLVAVIILQCGASFGRQALGYVAALCFCSIAVAGIVGDAFLAALSQHTLQMSDSWIQVSSLTLAAIVFAHFKRTLRKPPTPRVVSCNLEYSANVRWMPAFCVRDQPLFGPSLPGNVWQGQRLAKETALSGAALGVALALWIALPSRLVPDEILVVPWLIAIALQALLRMHNVHRGLSFAWIHGTLPSRPSRTDLGHRFAVRIAVLAMPWLAAGVAGAALHWQYAGGDGTFFEELIVVQIGTFVAIALQCRTRRLPAAPNFVFALAVSLAIVACAVLKPTTIEFGFVGFAALAITLACAVAALLIVGGRGLARAEIVN